MSTPITDALFDRHCAESRSIRGGNLAVRQVGELLEHAKRMESERTELIAVARDVLDCMMPVNTVYSWSEEQRATVRKLRDVVARLGAA